jgi:hypothetical protein
MKVCESKGDFSFIFSSAERDNPKQDIFPQFHHGLSQAVARQDIMVSTGSGWMMFAVSTPLLPPHWGKLEGRSFWPDFTLLKI